MKHSKKQISAMLAAAILSMAAATTVSAASRVGDEDLAGSSKATVQFTGGTIKLETVPALDFGNHDISGTEQSYAADSVSEVIQVSDLRGSGEGWKLLVSLSAFTHESDGAETLNGAEIRVRNPLVEALNNTVSTEPDPTEEVNITADNTQTPIWTAEKGAGMGVWGLEWKAADTKLAVNPGTARTGKSVATLTWSLQTTP